LRLGKGNANEAGWKVRVIPNKYPVTDYHEVIIHSPDCGKDIEDFPLSQVELVIRAYRERYNFYRKKGQVLIFCNHGEHAGASMKHPHSQLVVVPSQINMDTLTKEPLNNIVEQTKMFTAYCPDFSQWPYETWIAPTSGDAKFGDIDDGAVVELAKLLQRMIKSIKRMYDHHQLTHIPFGYNYYIYPGHTWYMRIIPRFVHRAGFELGTGLNVNIVDPTEAALELRGVETRMISLLSKLQEHLPAEKKKKKRS